MIIRQDSSNNATVDQNYYWMVIDDNTPKSSKIQLINKRDGVAMYGFLGKNKDLFTHWCPLPKFKETHD